MDTSKFKNFAREKLGIDFNNLNLLITALTHRSYINEHKKSATTHNERLEFLGDAVLELITTEFLYLEYDEPEGVLTSWRSSLVRTESIAKAADKLGYYEMLRLSKGEKRMGSDRAKEQILANTFEAVIGAIYLDKGVEVVRKFIHDNLLSTFEEILQSGSWIDPKSKLQELVQGDGHPAPIYKVIDEQGPDHEKNFVIGVFVSGMLYAKSQGTSKQSAQSSAALKALKAYYPDALKANPNNQE